VRVAAAAAGVAGVAGVAGLAGFGLAAVVGGLADAALRTLAA
jgi:hypothetical protein